MNQVLLRSLNTVGLGRPAGDLAAGHRCRGVLGAVTLQEFAIALLIGMITGAYSSIFVATPILGMLKDASHRIRTATPTASSARTGRIVVAGCRRARPRDRPTAAAVPSRARPAPSTRRRPTRRPAGAGPPRARQASVPSAAEPPRPRRRASAG